MSTTIEPASQAAVVSAVLERLNAHDVPGMASFLAEDVREDWPVVGRIEGRAAVSSYFEMMFAATPDLRLEVERTATDGETVFVHWRTTGTLTGEPFNGVRATGRLIGFRGTDCFTVRDGKIVANFIAYDGLTFAVQAGVLPRPGTAGDRAMTAAVNVVTRIRRLLRR